MRSNKLDCLVKRWFLYFRPRQLTFKFNSQVFLIPATVVDKIVTFEKISDSAQPTYFKQIYLSQFHKN